MMLIDLRDSEVVMSGCFRRINGGVACYRTPIGYVARAWMDNTLVMEIDTQDCLKFRRVFPLSSQTYCAYMKTCFEYLAVQAVPITSGTELLVRVLHGERPALYRAPGGVTADHVPVCVVQWGHGIGVKDAWDIGDSWPEGLELRRRE